MNSESACALLLCFVLEMGSLHVAQGGLQLLIIATASWVLEWQVRNSAVCHSCLFFCLFAYVIINRHGLTCWVSAGCAPNALLCKEAVSSFPAPRTQVQKDGLPGVQPKTPANAPPSLMGKQNDLMGTLGSDAPFFNTLKQQQEQPHGVWHGRTA